jgi:hypothetical protein
VNAKIRLALGALFIVLGVSLSILSGSILPASLTTDCTSFNSSTIPYSGPEVLVQAGNFQPKRQFEPRSSFQPIPDIRMGSGAYSCYTWRDLPGLDLSLHNFIEYGTWRLDTCVDENEEPIFWWYNCEAEFPEEYDRFIDGMNDNGVVVNYMLHFWDKTGHANGEELTTPRFQTEEQIQDFLDYTRFVVSHYQGSVHYYTIWSEPDCGGLKQILPEDYINLVRRTVPVIHEEDPHAKVAIAPNVLFFAQNYLAAVIESDLMTMVDVVQWNGIFNVLPNDSLYGDYYYQYPAIIDGIRQTAEAHGFDGEYWSCGISYSAEGNAPDQPWGYPSTDKQAAKYFARTIVMHLGWDIGIALNAWMPDTPPEIAPWSRPTTSHLYKILAGTRPINRTVTMYPEPINALTNTFEMPNGDMLVALWTHGEAVDDDPGISTTLTFPDLSAQQVIAIDVLNSFEQDLIVETWTGNLVIRNIFVRDYPLILRITNSRFSPGSPVTIVLILGFVIGLPIIVVSIYFFRKRRIR